MPVKQIKEINRDLSGNVFVEYADDSTTTFNVADTVTANVNPVTARIASLMAGARNALNDVGFVDYAVPSGAAPTLTKGGLPILYRSNGAPVTYASGFISSGAGAGQRAWYAETDMGAPVTRIGAEFFFTAGSGGLNGTINLSAWGTSVTASVNTPTNALHLSITRDGWDLGKILTVNGVITSYGSGAFKKPLTAGVKYTADISIDIANNTVYLRLPDGTTATATDASVGSIAGAWAGWEFYQFNGATDDTVSIGRMWAGTHDVLSSVDPAMAASTLDIPGKPTALGLTSVTSSSIGTSAAIVDATAVCNVYAGKSDKRVLCRFSLWVTAAASRSIILAPLFKNKDGSTLTQPFIFLLTAPAAGYAGYATLEFVQTVNSTQSVTCELWIQSTGAGDTMTVAANKPLTMSFTPLG